MHINVTIFVCINIYVNSSFWAEVEKLGFDAFGINVYEWMKKKTMDGGGRRCSFMHNMQCYSHKVIFRTQKSCIQIYFILLQLGVYISWYFWIENVVGGFQRWILFAFGKFFICNYIHMVYVIVAFNSI